MVTSPSLSKQRSFKGAVISGRIFSNKIGESIVMYSSLEPRLKCTVRFKVKSDVVGILTQVQIKSGLNYSHSSW